MEKSSGGVGLMTVLQVVFLVLKLCNVIKWSWVWVLSPTWIALGVSLVLFLVWLIIKLILNKKRRK